MAIEILSQDVAAKIAAGEVVERPANVAKELIENSLDSGASEVRVEIREGGRRLLRVSDDGHGIPAAELELAVARHATSKLRRAADLDAIETLGFRGEALYSIAAVSCMTLGSRVRGADAGAEMLVEGGSVQHIRSAGLPVGTVVTVEKIFFNMPARRKFLRRPATEAGHLAAIVQRYALAYPACRFHYVNEGKLVFSTDGSGLVIDVLTKIYGRESAQQLIGVGGMQEGSSTSGGSSGRMPDGDGEEEVSFMPETPPSAAGSRAWIGVAGYVSLPSLTRASRAQIDLFVNRRYVEDRALTHAVVQAYHTLLPGGRFPLAALFVELEAAAVDVNVHPRKTEVRFADARAVYSAVQRAVRRAVVEGAGVPDLPSPRADSQALAGADQSGWAARRRSILDAGAGRQPVMPVGLPYDRLPETEPLPELPGTQPDSGGPAAVQEDERGAPTEPDQGLPPLRVVGQAGAMYVIAEGPEGLYLIDQHAAHERILYEKFMAQRDRSGGPVTARQGLLEPITLHVGDRRAGLVAQHLTELDAVGFSVEHFGGDTFLVRAVPSALSHEDCEHVLDEIIQGLAENRDLVGEELEARLVKMVCNRASIKAGQILSDIEMKELVRQLEQCAAPRTCPHGRPTMLQLRAGELERAFKRT
ncbi:MAG: DNA mismatch repair endonuclease MutL [Caldilineaceae bacterium]|nr:DNA mismatch repair endonuclease MutL [Caldilineaceae bacterium]